MRLSSALAWLAARPPAPVVVPPTGDPSDLGPSDFGPRDLGLRTAPVIALPPPAPEPEPLWDLHDISPRDFAEIIHELYLSGRLTWEQYCMVGFPSELHPNYDATIGALTGEKAQPDKPRDMVAEWEKRLDFDRRYNTADRIIRRGEHVLAALRRHRHGFIPREA